MAEPLVAEVQRRADELGVPVRLAPVDSSGRLADPSAQPDVVVRGPGVSEGTVQRLTRAFPSVRWIHVASAGVDGLLTPDMMHRDLAVTRTRGLHPVPVAEFAISLVLMAAKSFPMMLRAQERHEWVEFQPEMISGKTLTIVGFGEIGHELAKLAGAFGMRVIGVRRNPRPDGLADEVLGVDRLAVALAQADFVVLIVPGTAESRHLIGARELRAMNPTAFLINVGRAELIDEPALLGALDRGELAGALLDTVSPEPLPSDSPLWSHPKVVVTPHAAGLRGGGFGGARLDQFLENVRRFGRGEPLANQVDKRLGY